MRETTWNKIEPPATIWNQQRSEEDSYYVYNIIDQRNIALLVATITKGSILDAGNVSWIRLYLVL